MRPDRLVPGDTPPGAPALAARGPHPVGVRTLTWRIADALDVQATVAANEPRRGPRELTVEAWYPAAAAEGTFAVYRDHLGRGLEDPERPPVPFERVGRAIRDAPAARSRAPLVVVSHGYPGSRYLLSWLGEHLASKGYAVLAPDHTGSTHADMGPALGALYHRPLDIAAVLDAAAAWGRDHPDLAGAWDPSNAALAGTRWAGTARWWRSARAWPRTPSTTRTCATRRCTARCSHRCARATRSTTRSSRASRPACAPRCCSPRGAATASGTPARWPSCAPRC
jgi:hypothetical protein